MLPSYGWTLPSLWTLGFNQSTWQQMASTLQVELALKVYFQPEFWVPRSLGLCVFFGQPCHVFSFWIHSLFCSSPWAVQEDVLSMPYAIHIADFLCYFTIPSCFQFVLKHLLQISRGFNHWASARRLLAMCSKSCCLAGFFSKLYVTDDYTSFSSTPCYMSKMIWFTNAF